MILLYWTNFYSNQPGLDTLTRKPLSTHQIFRCKSLNTLVKTFKNPKYLLRFPATLSFEVYVNKVVLRKNPQI